MQARKVFAEVLTGDLRIQDFDVNDLNLINLLPIVSCKLPSKVPSIVLFMSVRSVRTVMYVVDYTASRLSLLVFKI